jgi:hypothetical protein
VSAHRARDAVQLHALAIPRAPPSSVSPSCSVSNRFDCLADEGPPPPSPLPAVAASVCVNDYVGKGVVPHASENTPHHASTTRAATAAPTPLTSPPPASRPARCGVSCACALDDVLHSRHPTSRRVMLQRRQRSYRRLSAARTSASSDTLSSPSHLFSHSSAACLCAAAEPPPPPPSSFPHVTSHTSPACPSAAAEPCECAFISSSNCSAASRSAAAEPCANNFLFNKTQIPNR